MSGNSNRGYEMDEVSEARLWRTLEDISKRLINIESKLSEIVRLEEKLNNHHETLKRYGDRLDRHDERIRRVENWQSENVGRTWASGKVVAWIAASASAIVTGIVTAFAAFFIKGP